MFINFIERICGCIINYEDKWYISCIGKNGIYRSVNLKKIGGNFYIYLFDFRILIDYFNEMVFII